jgi:hypothetical protein
MNLIEKILGLKGNLPYNLITLSYDIKKYYSWEEGGWCFQKLFV